MRRFLAAILAIQVALSPAFGWGAHVHRTITYLALQGLPPQAPAWLRDPELAQRAAFQANQPDRWRGWQSDILSHENDPEHYLDTEQLAEFGLTLDTVPKLRREYLRALIIAKHEHPEQVGAYDASKDPARTQEWPGFVLHAVAEQYAKLQAAFQQVRILEKLNDPARAAQLAQAREIVVYHIGDLSHFVADMAQPLHTTKHFNGWVGPNPAGYKWREHFHSYIDSGFAEKHGIGIESLRPLVKLDVKLNARDPWDDTLEYFKRSFHEVEPLYALERDGELDGPEGERLINARLADATAMVEAMIWSAYESAAPTEKQVESWARYNDFDPSRLPGGGVPTTQPAVAP